MNLPKCTILCCMHIVPEKFENGSFTLKMHQMFSIHTTCTLEKFENGAITSHFALEQGNMVIV